MITIGSCFSGIGGFELGLERAIPNSKTIWHCEKDEFCRKVLRKHWQESHIYENIKHMHTQEVQRPDILCAGFPCQDISVAGKKEGLHGQNSSIFWSLESLICRIRPSIILLENVKQIIIRGGRQVLGALAELGYDAEWTTLSARQFGAPHLRERWFLVAYPKRKRWKKQPIHQKPMEAQRLSTNKDRHTRGIQRENYWKRFKSPPALCRVDDGISNRVLKLKALGNAIVPQCSEYIGHCIVRSGLLDELIR